MTDAKFELRYLVIPRNVYKDTRLTLTDFKVYGFIHAYINPFFFNNEHLGEMFGVHPQTISTAINHLEELGYIKLTHTPKSGGGTTRLCLDTQSDSVSTLSPNIYKENNRKDTLSRPIIKVGDGDVEEDDGSSFLEERSQKQSQKKTKVPFGYAQRYSPPQRREKMGTYAEDVR